MENSSVGSCMLSENVAWQTLLDFSHLKSWYPNATTVTVNNGSVSPISVGTQFLLTLVAGHISKVETVTVTVISDMGKSIELMVISSAGGQSNITINIKPYCGPKVESPDKCLIAVHIKQLVHAELGNPHYQLSNTLAAVLKMQSFTKTETLQHQNNSYY